MYETSSDCSLTEKVTLSTQTNRPSVSRKGLRCGVIFAQNMANQTASLIRSGAAMPYTAHATSPTITMPRVKAITTGSIPSFLDVILNFAESDISSTLATQDTWPGQLRAKDGGKLVMYGDDTWLKLFPGIFCRSDGTTSFFVSVSVITFAMCMLEALVAEECYTRILQRWIIM